MTLAVVLMSSLLNAQDYILRYDTVAAPDVHVFHEIYFEFDKSELREDYVSNMESLNNLHNFLDSISPEDLVGIEVISHSSPEGKYEHNMELSKKRSATMSEYMRGTYPELVDIMRINPDGESWDKIREFILADTCLSKETIKRIIDLIDSDYALSTKKWRMKIALGQDPAVGDVYKYIYDKYYTLARYSGISVIAKAYKVVPVRVPVQVESVEETPGFEADTVITGALLPVPMDTIEKAPADSLLRIPVLSLKTNLLYDAFFIPGYRYSPIVNAELEYYFPRRNWSIMAGMEFPWWSKDEDHYYFQMRDYQLEGRKYLAKGHDHNGHYLSIYGMYNLYDFCIDKENGRGVQGEGAGLGIGYGYVLPISKDNRWKLEFFLKAGYYESHYDDYEITTPYNGKYYYMWKGNPDDFIPRNQRFRWLGPTGLGVTISYDLIMRRVRSDFFENE